MPSRKRQTHTTRLRDLAAAVKRAIGHSDYDRSATINFHQPRERIYSRATLSPVEETCWQLYYHLQSSSDRAIQMGKNKLKETGTMRPLRELYWVRACVYQIQRRAKFISVFLLISTIGMNRERFTGVTTSCISKTIFDTIIICDPCFIVFNLVSHRALFEPLWSLLNGSDVHIPFLKHL